MINRLDIIDKQLELGDVKTITSGSGSIIKMIEMLFSTTTKAQFAPSDNKKSISFCIKDVNLELPQYQSEFNKKTLYDLIIALKSLYNQIEEEE